MFITIDTFPHESQRYPTCGDWQFLPQYKMLEIKVSELGNWKYEALIGVHELIEAILCKARRIKQEDVDKFDIAFEKKRKKGNLKEPGDDEKAPYFNEHQFATHIETLLAEELKVKWPDYEKAVNKL